MSPRQNSPLKVSEKIRAIPLYQWLLFAIGFFGWYLATYWIWPGLIAGDNGSGDYIILNIIIFPVNIILLRILAAIPPARPISLGILAAIAMNFAISVIEGLWMNAMCLIPFYVK